ncbi:MAG: aminotransferase class I/II-fold pyridoxal phosphate-dependent enzyme [Cyanobacteria bacterium J06597_1]
MGSREQFFERVDRVFDRNWLTNDGPLVKEFEAKIASFLNVRHCIATCSGTIALEIALRSLGLTGEVILPSYTFIATAHALQWQGLTPVFADIDPKTHNIDPNSVRERISERTSAILAVHLWGRGAPYEELQAIACEHNIKLLFDAAHAFGCSLGGRKIGSFGACEVLSFHATKFFNSFEGGAVVTNDDALASEVRLMRNFGFAGLDNVMSVGTNGKMPEVCAAMGLTNFDNIDTVIAANRANYEAYRDGVSSIPGLTLCTYDEAEGNNFQYIVIETDEQFPLSRDEVIQVLHAENVNARRYFWPGCHSMQPYQSMYPNAAQLLPRTVDVANRVVVLPTGTAVSVEQVQQIVAILECIARPENADPIRDRLNKSLSFQFKQTVKPDIRKAS